MANLQCIYTIKAMSKTYNITIKAMFKTYKIKCEIEESLSKLEIAIPNCLRPHRQP